MKFYCDACNRKYAIADEKVRGKVLKVRCKMCGNIITVREARAPVASASSGPASAATSGDLAQVPSTNWYYALNGETFGPFTVDGLREKYKSAEIGDETYVWHEALAEWKPVATVDAFSNALAIGQQVRPSHKTLGFSGQLEAVRDVEPRSGRQKGFVPGSAPAGRTGPAPSPEASGPAGRPQQKRPVKDLRKEKLEKLRARLAAEDAKRETASATAEPSKTSSVSADEWSDIPDTEALPTPVGGEAMLTFAEGITPASASDSIEFSESAERAADGIDFSAPSSRSGPAKPVTSSTSDILDAVVGDVDSGPGDASRDSGLIPMPSGAQFPTPSGVAQPQASSHTSGSLLIQIDKIKKEGQPKRWMLVGVVALLVIGLTGAAVILSMQKEAQPTVATKTDEPDPEHKDELVIPTYEKDEVGRIENSVELDEELEFTIEELEPAESGAAEKTGEDESTGVARDEERPSIRRADDGPKVASKTTEKTEKEAEPAEEAERGSDEDDEDDEDSVYKALLSKRAGKSAKVRAPDDAILDAKGNQTGLTKAEARRGIRRVKDSVATCRERHNRRSGRLNAGKLKVSLRVQPSGDVSGFDLNPRSVRNTEFDRCMQSHRRRWRFASFQGREVIINTSMVIQ